MDAKALIELLQRSVLAWMDGDQFLPTDGAASLALLAQAQEALTVGNAPAAMAEIDAFIRRVQALTDAGVLDVAEGHPLIEAAASLRAWLGSDVGTGLQSSNRMANSGKET